MCTTISDKTGIGGSGKGATGWFELDHVYIGYDHPYHAPLDHALSLDFVNEAAGPGARVAVELDRESARALAHRILETLELADAYEGNPTSPEAAVSAEGSMACSRDSIRETF